MCVLICLTIHHILRRTRRPLNIMLIPPHSVVGFRLFADIITVVRLIRLISINKYSFVLSFTPKAGLVSSIAILLCALLFHRPAYFHYFTGLLWPHLNSSSPIRIFLSFCDWLIISASSRVFCDSPSQEMTLRHAFPSSVSKNIVY